MAVSLAFVTSWFTPTSLFLFLNLVIGTIVVTSRFTIASKRHHHDQEHHQHHRDSPLAPPLARAPSLLDRVKSINFSHYYHQHSEPEYSHQVDPLPLARPPSLLQRLKSVNFSSYRYENPNPGSETVHHRIEPEYTARFDDHPPPLARTPSLLQRLKSINFSSWQDDPNQEPRSDPEHQPEYRAQPDPPPIARVPSFLERVKSINFSLYGQDNEYPEDTDPVHVEDYLDPHHVKRVNSDTKPSGGEALAKLPGKMRKSASHKSAFGHFGYEKTVDDTVELRRRPESVREGRKRGGAAAGDEEGEEGEHIDSKADDFINKFRQQLKLQRLDSIRRYTDMLTRAHAKN